MKYELAVREDGTHELVDKSPVAFKPTEEQLLFLERLFWDWDYELDEEKAVKSVGGEKSTVRRWKRDPAFVALYRNEAEKALGLGIDNAKALIVKTLDHKYQPTRDEKWAAKQLLGIEESIRQAEYKLYQIHNTQNNFYSASVSMTDDQLKQIMEKGYANGEAKEAIPQGAGKDS